MVYSARYLSEWILDHPLRDYSEAPLWIKLTGKMRLQAVEYKDVQTQLKKIARRAGIKKRIYPLQAHKSYKTAFQSSRVHRSEIHGLG